MSKRTYSTFRYWVDNEHPTAIGDIKSGLQQYDHLGWIKLDGRLKSSLTENQQEAATSLGIGTNLPNTTDCYLSQGVNLGSISGSNEISINRNNLPNIQLGGITSTEGNHFHEIGESGSHSHTLSTDGAHKHELKFKERTALVGTNTVADINGGGGASKDTQTNGDHTHTCSVEPDHTHSCSSTGDHNHSITTESLNGGVTVEPINIKPKCLEVNFFIFLNTY